VLRQQIEVVLQNSNYTKIHRSNKKVILLFYDSDTVVKYVSSSPRQSDIYFILYVRTHAFHFSR